MSDDYVDALWRGVKAGALTWDDVQALQDAIYPRCEAHPDRAGKGLIDGRRLCEDCFAAYLTARRAAC